MGDMPDRPTEASLAERSLRAVEQVDLEDLGDPRKAFDALWDARFRFNMRGQLADTPAAMSLALCVSTVLDALIVVLRTRDGNALDRLVAAARAELPALDEPLPPAIHEYGRRAREALARGAPLPSRTKAEEEAFALVSARSATPKFDATRTPKRGQKSGDMNQLAAFVRSEAEKMKRAGRPPNEIVEFAVATVTTHAWGLKVPETSDALKADIQALKTEFGVGALDTKALVRAVFRRFGWEVPLFKAEDTARSRDKRKRAGNK